MVFSMRNGRLTQLMQRALAGRYGPDRFSRFLSQGSVGLLILSVLSRWGARPRASALFFSLAMLMLAICYLRMFSTNFEKRQAEEHLYLEKEWAVRDWLSFRKDRFDQRKDYCFFTCPGCKQTVRVPKNKGRIRITCRRCGYSFDKKT